MNEEDVPRDPSHYRPSVHAKQRVKYGKNPQINWEHVTEAIADGHLHEERKGRYSFAKWITISQGDGRYEHSVRVVASPDSGVIQSVYCPCWPDNGVHCGILEDADHDLWVPPKE